MPDLDLRAAVNAISDVIMNRPRPLREFDQIHMKAGDMVMQAEFVARWSDGRNLVFIGDGDAISVCVTYLRARDILPYGPKSVVVMDFDERVVTAIKRFAAAEKVEGLDAVLYNCLDDMPRLPRFDHFYTNPPWGASNGGTSVHLFAYRGMQAIGHSGEGLVVIADDDSVPWAQDVLASTQRFALEQGFYVKRMTPELHSYHLDDAPELRSCNLLLRSLPGPPAAPALAIDEAFLANFYGAGKAPRVKYVRERDHVDYGRAHPDEYELELLP